MNYEELLAKAKEQLPEIAQGSQRFEIPKVKGHIQGNNTIISNFNIITEKLDRPNTHIAKYLSKQLAAKAHIQKEQFLVFNTKIAASKINEKIQSYADRYVLCPSCKKPETKIERKGLVLVLCCKACGAENTIQKAE